MVAPGWKLPQIVSVATRSEALSEKKFLTVTPRKKDISASNERFPAAKGGSSEVSWPKASGFVSDLRLVSGQLMVNQRLARAALIVRRDQPIFADIIRIVCSRKWESLRNSRYPSQRPQAPFARLGGR